MKKNISNSESFNYLLAEVWYIIVRFKKKNLNTKIVYAVVNFGSEYNVLAEVHQTLWNWFHFVTPNKTFL